VQRCKIKKMIDLELLNIKYNNEKGVASVLAICLFGIIVFFSMAVLTLGRNEKKIIDGFSDGLTAQALAESGAERAILKLKEDGSWLMKAKNQKYPEYAAVVISAAIPENESNYQVYLVYDDFRYVLMSMSNFHGQQGQVFVYLLPTESGFVVERWEK
jgi:hypothetical protein